MGIKQNVECSYCGKIIRRVVWNYSKNKPIQNFFCNVNCKGLWQKKQREALGYTKDWLEDQYFNKGKSVAEIARIINRNPKRVLEWFNDYGIKIKGRGQHENCNKFKKGNVSSFKGRKHSEITKNKLREISLKDGRVPYLKDGVHWLHYYNLKPASWKGGVTPERQAMYSSDKWKECVKHVWKRDNATCQRCGKKHNDGNRNTFNIHHIYPFAKYKHLRCQPDVLVLLCRDCHLFVHSKKNINHEFMLKPISLPSWILKAKNNEVENEK